MSALVVFGVTTPDGRRREDGRGLARLPVGFHALESHDHRSGEEQRDEDPPHPAVAAGCVRSSGAFGGWTVRRRHGRGAGRWLEFGHDRDLLGMAFRAFSPQEAENDGDE